MSIDPQTEQRIREAKHEVSCDCGRTYIVTGAEILDTESVVCIECGRKQFTAGLLYDLKKEHGIEDRGGEDAQKRLDKMIEDFKQNQKRR